MIWDGIVGKYFFELMLLLEQQMALILEFEASANYYLHRKPILHCVAWEYVPVFWCPDATVVLGTKYSALFYLQ